MAADPDDEADEDEQWRFSLSDLDDSDEADRESGGEKGRDGNEDGGNQNGDGNEDGDGNVFGSLDAEEELVAGDVDLENALFVAVGILLAVAFVFGFVTLLP